jgi:NADH:ubiquinone oxidoreductase subunit
VESRYFWNKIKNYFFGKFVGKDSFGNKYYESKNGKRWVIYSDEIDASKIPVNGILGYILLQIKLKKIMI